MSEKATITCRTCGLRFATSERLNSAACPRCGSNNFTNITVREPKDIRSIPNA